MTSADPNPQPWDAKRLRLATDAAGVGLWDWNVETDKINMDRPACELWDVPCGEPITFKDLSARIHPKDLDRVRAGFAATRSVVGPYEIDFRIIIGDKIRWVSARGLGSDAAIVAKVMTGIFLDVTQRKQVEEGHELLSGEMSHRVKNLLTLASGLTTLTSRTSTTVMDMAEKLTGRLAALGRAHDLALPAPDKKTHSALLGDLLTVLLAPYDVIGAFEGRVRVSVPRMAIGQSAATSLALVVHELATNAVKHGALSTAHGTLDVSCNTSGDEVVVVWMERGGPAVTRPLSPTGSGTKMIDRGMSRQLGGSVDFDWAPGGVIATLRMHKERLAT